MVWILWERFWHLLSKPVSDLPSEEGEGFSSEILAGIRHGKLIYLDMNYEEELKYTAQYGIAFQLYTAVKMENSKKSSTTRVTANPQRVPKWIISDLESEVRAESWRYPCLTQTKSSQWRSSFWETLGTEIRSGFQWLIMFQDCAAWSEGQRELDIFHIPESSKDYSQRRMGYWWAGVSRLLQKNISVDMAAPNPNFYEKNTWDNGLLGEFSVAAGKWHQPIGMLRTTWHNHYNIEDHKVFWRQKG